MAAVRSDWRPSRRAATMGCKEGRVVCQPLRRSLRPIHPNPMLRRREPPLQHSVTAGSQTKQRRRGRARQADEGEPQSGHPTRSSLFSHFSHGVVSQLFQFTRSHPALTPPSFNVVLHFPTHLTLTTLSCVKHGAKISIHLLCECIVNCGVQST